MVLSRMANVTRKNRKCKSKLLNFGNITNIDDCYRGKPIFRKIANFTEIKLVPFLKEHPHPNLLHIYRINKDKIYYDSEIVKPNVKISKKLIDTMKQLKEYLQALGMLYVDWKPDNIGIGGDGLYKLYDYGDSCLLDTSTNKWIVHPPGDLNWYWRTATENGLTDPYEIDNWAFDIGFGIKKYDIN
jgi:serine/threonine protein kinase